MSNELLYVTPEQAGISTHAIQRFLDRVEQKGIELHSFMLLRHGKVCAQGWWKPYQAEYVHPMYSFSKSLTSTAMGRFRTHYIFEAEIRCTQTAFGMRMLFQFGNGTLTISRCKTLLGYGDEPAAPDLVLKEKEMQV